MCPTPQSSGDEPPRLDVSAVKSRDDLVNRLVEFDNINETIVLCVQLWERLYCSDLESASRT